MTYRDRTIAKPTRRLRLRVALCLLTAALFLTMTGPAFVAALTTSASEIALPALLINELQSSGCSTLQPCVEDTKMEFVELYNTSSLPLQVSGWKVRYLSSSGATPTELVTMSGQIAPHSYILIAHAGYFPAADLFYGSPTSAGVLAKTGGHVEILDSSATSIDRVGWGTATQAPTKPITASLPGQSIERATDSAGLPLQSNNNFADFVVQTEPNPQSGGLSVISDAPPAVEPSSESATTTTPEPTPIVPPITTPIDPLPSCAGITISELLPNPAGTDGGHEYIEVHNPTDQAISLDGCSLQSSASSSKQYAFGQTSLQSGEYRSFSDTETAITLPNSAGGTVWLLDSVDEILAVTYPADMADDSAWALVGDTWITTYTPTPGGANIATALKPCEEAGQVRNPDTNRCINQTTVDTAITSNSPTTSTSTAATASPASCKVGQERNPATNRCRTITSAVSSTTSCKTGQERNPDTNRCRNIVAQAATTKACPAGQERNADTNRCRKITAAGSSNGSSLDSVKDAANGTLAGKQKPYLLVAALAVAAAVAYGIYEWRQEIRALFAKRLHDTGPMPATQP